MKNIESTVAIQDNVESHLCTEWEYITILVEYIKKYIESFHEGLCYSCYHCDYKAKYVSYQTICKIGS